MSDTHLLMSELITVNNQRVNMYMYLKQAAAAALIVINCQLIVHICTGAHKIPHTNT